MGWSRVGEILQRWLAMSGEMLVALVVMLALGFAIAVLLNIKGPNQLLFAPLISLGLIGTVSFGFGLVGIPFTLLTYLLAVLLIGVALFFFCCDGKYRDRIPRFAERVRERFPAWQTRLAAADSHYDAHNEWRDFVRFGLPGLLFAIPISLIPIMRAVGNPSIPFQGNDAIFHYSATRFIIENHVATPMSVASLVGTFFYPSLWHTATSLTYLGSITAAMQAATFVTVGFIWPISITALARTVFPKRPEILFIAPVLSAGFAAFPAALMGIFPLLLSLALVPGLVAVCYRILSGTELRVPLLVIAAIGAFAVFVAHPQGLLLSSVVLIYPTIKKLVALLREPNHLIYKIVLSLLIVAIIALWALSAVFLGGA